MSDAMWVLVTLCILQAVLIVFLWCLYRDERSERRFWYESSCRAWDSLFGLAHIGDESDDD